jgi:hypothetical protein
MHPRAQEAPCAETISRIADGRCFLNWAEFISSNDCTSERSMIGQLNSVGFGIYSGRRWWGGGLVNIGECKCGIMGRPLRVLVRMDFCLF